MECPKCGKKLEYRVNQDGKNELYVCPDKKCIIAYSIVDLKDMLTPKKKFLISVKCPDCNSEHLAYNEKSNFYTCDICKLFFNHDNVNITTATHRYQRAEIKLAEKDKRIKELEEEKDVSGIVERSSNEISDTMKHIKENVPKMWKEERAMYREWYEKEKKENTKLKQCLSNIEQGVEELGMACCEMVTSPDKDEAMCFDYKDEVLALIKENKKEVE